MYQYARKKDESSLRNLFLTIAIICLVIFIVIAYMGKNEWAQITAIDTKVSTYFYNLHTSSRTPIATAITRIADFSGQVISTIIYTVIILLFKKWRTALWYGITVLFGAGIINGTVKAFFQRARPTDIEHLVEQGGYAFPSGHSMGSIIIYGGLLFILMRYINSKRSYWPVGKWVLSIVTVLLILSIGLSRIYLGVHFPTDVIGGFALGLSWLSFSVAFLGLPLTKKEFKTKGRYHYKTL